MASIEVRRKEISPLQVAIDVTNDLSGLGIITDQESGLITSRLGQFLEFQHNVPMDKLVDQVNDLYWLTRAGKIGPEDYHLQYTSLAKRLLYCDTLRQPDLELLKEKSALPNFILNAIEKMNDDRWFYKDLESSIRQVKDLPIHAEQNLDLNRANAASNTVNALVPFPLDLRRPDALVNFNSEDVRTSINRIARLVCLDPQVLQEYNFEPLKGEGAYNTLLAMLMQNHFISQKETNKVEISIARQTLATSSLFSGVIGIPTGLMALEAILSGDFPRATAFGMVSFIMNLVGAPFMALSYFNTKKVGLRNILGLPSKPSKKMLP